MSQLMRLWYFVLRKLILQTRMCSHPVGLAVLFLVRPFVYFHTWYMPTVTALMRLRESAASPEPSLVAYVISTIISWAGSNVVIIVSKHQTTKVLIRLCKCAGWSVLLLFCTWHKTGFLMIWLKYSICIISVLLVWYAKLKKTNPFFSSGCQMSLLMRLWYSSAQSCQSLRCSHVMKYGSRRVWPKIRHQEPLDVCACVFEEWVYGGRKVP